MKISIIILYLIYVFSFPLTAQKHDYVWTLGYDDFYPLFGGTNLNFNKNPVDTDYIKRDINIHWDCSSICNKDGKLLFYTNGCKIFNANNKLLKNGMGLNPSPTSTLHCPDGNLMTQGSMFIPHPTDTALYYLFHLCPSDWIKKDNLGLIADKLYYTLIDLRKDNGLGEVILKNKLIYEDTLAFGKMTAVQHGNGRDWWIITSRMFKNQYIKILLSDKGITGPYYQNIGDKNIDDNGTGQSVFSPDGSKYIHFDRYNDLNIFDFNRCTGELSNPQRILIPTARDSITVKVPKYTVGGVAVSPNSRWLYVTTQTDVFQYDLYAPNIDSSVTLIAEYDNFAENGLDTRFFMPHIAPDNKIYINCTNGVSYLHVINNPDESGRNCNLTQHSFRLSTLNAASIPNFPNFRLGALKNSSCDTIKTSATSNIATNIYANISISPNPSQQSLNIQYEFPSDATWLLYNNTGQVVFQQTLQHNANQINIDTNHLSNGIYFWQVLINGTTLQRGKHIILK